jgi:hypothetical protein
MGIAGAALLTDASRAVAATADVVIFVEKIMMGKSKA